MSSTRRGHGSCTLVPACMGTVGSKTGNAWRTRVNHIRRSRMSALLCAVAVIIFASAAIAATTSKTLQLSQGERAKVSGVILTRNGDLIRLRDKKSQEVITVS